MGYLPFLSFASKNFPQKPFLLSLGRVSSIKRVENFLKFLLISEPGAMENRSFPLVDRGHGCLKIVRICQKTLWSMLFSVLFQRDERFLVIAVDQDLNILLLRKSQFLKHPEQPLDVGEAGKAQDGHHQDLVGHLKILRDISSMD